MTIKRKVWSFINIHLSFCWSNFLRLFPRRSPKVKLVSIARDEAAYLAEWIFHHLECNFDAISIYLNNTTDNSAELANALKNESRVTFCDGDVFFQNTTADPQVAVYTHELCKARWQGFSNIMFLDIDEFLMTSNIAVDIKEFAKDLEADVCVFEWGLRLNEEAPFLPAIQQELKLQKAKPVKPLISTRAMFGYVNPHNVYHKSTKYCLADRRPIEFSRENYTKVSDEDLKGPLKPVFVMHRMIRNELEYIAALKRGRPIKRNRVDSVFKNNRTGILKSESFIEVSINEQEFQSYCDRKNEYYEKYKLCSQENVGRKCVKNRFNEVVKLIEEAPIKEAETLRKVLKNTNMPEVIKAHNKFKSQHNLE